MLPPDQASEMYNNSSVVREANNVKIVIILFVRLPIPINCSGQFVP